MSSDYYLVIGLIVGALSIPAVISAFSESRPPRAAAILIIISAGMILTAVLQKPGGYSFEEIPAAFVSVMRSVLP
ncbi:MAG: hypothetical protein AAGJ91_17115 [Pseudomonadota bacterium]